MFSSLYTSLGSVLYSTYVYDSGNQPFAVSVSAVSWHSGKAAAGGCPWDPNLDSCTSGLRLPRLRGWSEDLEQDASASEMLGQRAGNPHDSECANWHPFEGFGNRSIWNSVSNRNGIGGDDDDDDHDDDDNDDAHEDDGDDDDDGGIMVTKKKLMMPMPASCH